MHYSPRGLENSGAAGNGHRQPDGTGPEAFHQSSLHRNEDGRPVAHQDLPDARETHTTAVSTDSVPPLEIFPITAGDGDDAGESPIAVYEELLHEACNPIDVRLNRFALQIEEIRSHMLELLLAGYGPEHSDLWGRLASEMQVLFVDFGNLSTDVVIIMGGLRRQVSRSSLTWVIWHEDEVQSCVNRDQCLAAIAKAARSGFDLNQLEVGIDSELEIARLLRGHRLDPTTDEVI